MTPRQLSVITIYRKVVYYMAVSLWYFVKRDLYSVYHCAIAYIAPLFQGIRATLTCSSGRIVPDIRTPRLLLCAVVPSRGRPARYSAATLVGYSHASAQQPKQEPVQGNRPMTTLATLTK